MLDKLKEQVYQLHLELPKYDLVVWTGGNVSARDPESGLVVIKPSGIRYEKLRPEDHVVVNLQGDEPLMDPQLVAAVAGLLADPDVDVGTACIAADAGALDDPDRVKVVLSASGRALYVSRAPIPWPRDGVSAPVRVHLGIYAYRAGFVRRFAGWEPSAAEQQEKEPLRDDPDDHDDRGEMGDKVEEAEAGGGSDQDVRRVADQRCDAADVR